MKIGVLDIQGSVEEHFEALKRLAKARPVLKIEPVLVKKISDLDGVRGLIIPGGESTTIGKLLKKNGMWEEIGKRAKGVAGSGLQGSRDSFPRQGGVAVWGTCAGAILLAKGWLGLMDIEVERNAYGRQMDSFETEVKFDFEGMAEGSRATGHKFHAAGRDEMGSKKIRPSAVVPAIFIRAPKIVKVGSGVQVLAKCNGEIVAASQGRFLATTFHPELTECFRIHELFVEEFCR